MITTANKLWALVCMAVVPSVCLAPAETNEPPILEDPQVHWTFNEGSGTTALDSSPNNYTATIVGASYVPGRWESSLSFDGTDQYAYTSDAQSGGTTGAGLDIGTRDWTVSAWVNTTTSGMVVTKMGFFGGSNPDGWGVSISGNGTVGVHLRKSGVGEVNIFSGDGKTVNDGQWHHLAVVFNRAGNLVRYVDGAPSGT